MPTTLQMAVYNDDNTVEVIISKDGLPSATALCPAPFMSEVDRAKRVDVARRDAWLNGWFIVSERRIRNDAFDKLGEKTTTEFKFRACKTKSEAEFVGQKIAEVLDTRVTHVAEEVAPAPV